MSRTAEAVLVLATTGLAVFGVLLVNFAEGTYLNRQAALTILVFGVVFGGLLTAVHRWASGSVPYLIPLAATLTAVGFVMIYRLDHDLAGQQSWWIMLSAGLAALALFRLQRRGVASLRPFGWVCLAAAVLFLALPAIPAVAPPLHGTSPTGPTWRWATEIVFRSGEIARLLLVIFLASYLADRQSSLATGVRTIGRFRLPEFGALLPMGLAGLAAFGVLVYENDLGTSLLLFGLFPIMFYIATNRPAYLTVGFGVYALGLAGAVLLDPGVRGSVGAWLRPWTDDTEVGSHIVQSLFALAAGSISGTGPGLGEPDLVPTAATSHLFAAVAEELGLAGSIVVLAAYVLLVATGFGIALRSRDLFSKLLASGLSLLLGLQTVLLLAGLVRLLPPSSLLAPFMSYGGASSVAAFVWLALLARVSHEERT